MDNDNKRLNFIVWFGIINLISMVVFGIYMMVYASNLDKAFNSFEFTKFFNDNQIAVIIILIVFVAFDFIPSISILAIKWESDWCTANRILFGILNIFLPFLMPFIYAGIARKK